LGELTVAAGPGRHEENDSQQPNADPHGTFYASVREPPHARVTIAEEQREINVARRREATARPARGLTNLGRLRQVLRLDLSEDSRRSLAQVPPRLARRSR